MMTPNFIEELKALMAKHNIKSITPMNDKMLIGYAEDGKFTITYAHFRGEIRDERVDELLEGILGHNGNRPFVTDEAGKELKDAGIVLEFTAEGIKWKRTRPLHKTSGGE